MKSILKYSAIALALALAHQASAVDIVLTGSTAFRGSTHDAIKAIMTGAETVVHSAAALKDSNQATFKGTIPGITGTVYVYCSWSGSASGVLAVANGTTVPVYSQSFIDAKTAGTTTVSAGSTDATMVPKIAGSDVFKASITGSGAGFTALGPVNSKVAVIPFRFLRNRGSNALLTNVTAQQYRAIWNNNQQPLAMFTGNSADIEPVIPVGRDNGSGTRITVMAETKYGIGNNVLQWKVTTTGTAGTDAVATRAQIWGVGDGVGSTSAGNGGYDSGSKIATVLAATSDSLDLFDSDNTTDLGVDSDVTILGYLGLSDAATAITNGATALPYEGYNYTAAGVQEGQYTLWGYFHFIHPTLTTDETTFKTALIGTTGLGNSSILGTNGIALGTMIASRTSDGAIVGR